MFPAERIETGDADVEVGQRHGDGRIAHVLAEVGSRTERHADARERRAPVDRRGTCRLGERLRVVHTRQVVTLITRRSEVDTGRERAERVGLRILPVAPLHLETRLLRIVGHTLVTRPCVLITHEKRTTVFITFVIVARSCQAPRAFCIDLTYQFQVHLVAQGKIVAAVTKIESTGALVSIAGHDETGTVAFREGEEAIRDSERQRHISHHEIGRTKRHVLSRTHLGAGKRNVEIRMLLVARGITAVSQINVSRLRTLRYFASKKAIFLFGISILHDTLFRLEVEGDGVGVISVRAHGKDRPSFDTTLLGTVRRSCGMNERRVKIHPDLVTLQVHVLVFDLCITEEFGIFGHRVVDERVVGRVSHRRIYSFPSRPVDRIGPDRVINGFVMMIDGKLERVHGERIDRRIVLLHAFCPQRILV